VFHPKRIYNRVEIGFSLPVPTNTFRLVSNAKNFAPLTINRFWKVKEKWTTFYPLFLAHSHVWYANGCLCPLFWNIFSYIEEAISFLCSPRRPGRHRVSAPLSRAAGSITTRCPGRRRVLPPVVQGSMECHHPLSGAARSVFHLLSRLTPKRFLNLSPYKSYTKVKCSNVVQVDAQPWTPTSGVTQSVTTHCPGRRGVLPPVVRGGVECHHPLPWATRKFYWSAQSEL